MIKAWTRFHYPFAIGQLWQPRGCEVECSSPIPVGQGFSVVRITSPTGLVFYAEERSGGLQGQDLPALIAALDGFDPVELERQVSAACAVAEQVLLVDREEWWDRLTKLAGRPKREAPEPERRRRTVQP